MAIGANRLAQSLAGSLAFGQTVLLDPGAIALRPVRPVLPGQPLGRRSGHGVERGPQRLANQFQVVEAADCRQNVSGVGALLAARLDQAALAQVLQEAEDRVQPSDRDDYSEPMLVDLAARLERRGLRVNIGHKGKLALVAAHGTRAVVVETDRDVSTQSLRVSLRLRPELLRRLGWHYLRVHNFELFADPEAVAARVAGLIGGPADEAPAPEPETPAAAVVATAAPAPVSSETQPIEIQPRDDA